MSLHEPRCLVCGAPLGQGAPFEKEARNSEVCSDECYEKYIEGKEITITVKEYEELKNRDLWFTAYEHAGVDNWQGGDNVYEIYQELGGKD